MFNCYGCRRTFETTHSLIYHMRGNCKALASSSGFRCGQPGCYREFSSGVSLRRHLEKCHAVRFNPLLFDRNELINSNSALNIYVSPSTSVDDTFCTTAQSPELELSITKIMQPNVACFLSHLYGKTNLPRNIVTTVAQELNKLFHKSKGVITQSIFTSLNNAGIQISADVIGIIENVMGDYAASASGLLTEYRIFQFFEKNGTLLFPQEICIGERDEYRRSDFGFSLVKVPCSMQVIPIDRVLKLFLSISGIMKDILDNIERFRNTNACIENIMQGKVWSEITNDIITSPNELTLPIILFYDDFEIGNPLGSHATIHKLGGVYISLPFLPSHYFSRLSNIFLLSLFHASDRTNFGNNVIFKNIADKLNSLRTDGFSIKTDDFTGVVKLRVACVTGDNLGLNSVLGFVENFVSQHCCRICNANKQQLQTLCFEDHALLRTPEEYEQQLLVSDATKTGIKERCVLLDSLKGFKLFDHVAVDIVHDYLEGCCRYVMLSVIKHYVLISKIVPLNILQSRLQSFDYGPDSGSKPCGCIVVDGSNLKLKTSAAEMLTLLRYFGLIIGFYIPEDDEVWCLFINLRRILDRLINPYVTNETVEQLKFYIAELNDSYCSLFNTLLKPKFHFLVHYPEMLLRFGPLTQIWTMRFEARHKVSKEAARASSSKVNICKTVAVKNQLLLNDLFVRNERWHFVEWGKSSTVDENIKSELQKKFLFDNDKVYSVNWISLNGRKLKKSSVVTIDINTESFIPIFGEIREIYIVTDKLIFFFCSLFKTVYYDLHFYAYKVLRTTDTLYVGCNNLHSIVPVNLTLMQDYQLYITVRMPFD